MGADKNSLQRELGLYPEITSKRPPQVLSRSRSNQDATDPRNNTLTQVLETRSGTTNSGTQASTGQTGQRHRSDRSRAGSPDQDTPGHPRANRDETGHPDLNHRGTRPTPMITRNQHYTGQTGQRPVTRPVHAGSPVLHTPGHPPSHRGKPGHPSNPRRVTRPTPVTSPRNHSTGQTGVGHRSDRSLAIFPKLVQNLSSRPRWKSQAVDQTGTSQPRSWSKDSPQNREQTKLSKANLAPEAL